MAKIAKKTKRYPNGPDRRGSGSVISAAACPKRLDGGAANAKTDMREVMNAIRYMARPGGGWRMLPKEFGALAAPSAGWFRELRTTACCFSTIHDVALMIDRERCAGAGGEPLRQAVLDSQTIKAPQGKTRGYDAGKKIVGRKRHIAVDTDGRLLMVHLTSADVSDSAGAQAILDAIRKRWPWVKHLFADGAYDRLKLMDKAAYLDFVVEIIRRSDRQKGFEVLPRRWVVERSFGWMTRWRRLVRDYEARIDVSQAMILVAMGGNLLRRTTHP